MARKAIYKHATEVNASTYPDDGSSPVGTNEWNEAPDQAGMFGNTPATATITIATGALTVTDSVTVAAAEAGTSDDLDKLVITNTNEYDLIYLFADTGDTITLKHTSTPFVTGQIQTISGADEILSETKPTILIRNGDYWYGYGGSAVNEINDIGDVVITSVANEDVLAYDTTTSKWINQSADETGRVTADSTTTFTNKTISQAQITSLTSDLALKSNKASPTFTGTTTAADLTVTGTITGDVTGDITGDVTGNADTVTTNANLTGIVTSTGNATAIANGAIANGKLTTDPLDYANMTAPSASVAFNSQKITGLADGVNAQDAATKSQVDAAQAGLDSKYACRVATTANVTLSGEQTIDGVLTSTDRILVKDQTTASENGIYVTASGAWARSSDANTSVEVTSGLYTLITEGTAGAGQGFVLVTADPITLDTTALTFSQFSGVGDLVGGTGITKTGNTISVDASQTQITAIGTLTAGTLTGATGLPPSGVVGTAAILGANTFTGSQTLPSTILKSQGTPGIGGLTFEPTASNSIGHLVINPSGTNNRAQLSITRQSDPTTNVDALSFGSDIVATNEFGFRTFSAGTGTTRPFSFYVDATKVLNFPANASGVEVNVGMDMLGNNIDNIQNLVHDTSATSTALDFTADQLQTISISVNTTFSTSNLAIGRSKTIRITTDATLRTLTFPAWKFVGAKPTDQAASKVGILTITSFGTTDADCVAAYAVEE